MLETCRIGIPRLKLVQVSEQMILESRALSSDFLYLGLDMAQTKDFRLWTWTCLSLNKVSV